MSPLRIPESPDAISADRLTAALRETGTIRAAAIESFTVEALGDAANRIKQETAAPYTTS